jgi:hypothetical protein
MVRIVGDVVISSVNYLSITVLFINFLPPPFPKTLLGG